MPRLKNPAVEEYLKFWKIHIWTMQHLNRLRKNMDLLYLQHELYFWPANSILNWWTADGIADPSISSSPWAAITVYHRLGSLSNRHLFLIVHRPGESKIKVPTETVSYPASRLIDNHLLTVGSRRRGGEDKDRERERDLQVRVIIPSWGSHTSWPNLSLIISPRPHLQIPSHLGLGLQHKNLGESKHSTLSSQSYTCAFII